MTERYRIANSGTTGIQAIRLGRKFLGCEREPEYYETAERRIKEESGMRMAEFFE
jgi:DNA modification methylase